MKLQPRPFPIVVSGPSGVGKSTFLGKIREVNPGIGVSVSVTTRARRGDEQDGREYTFVSEEEFQRRIERGELVEWAEVHGSKYGTPYDELDGKLRKGRSVLLELDVQGGRSIKKAYPEALLVFILPPEPAVLAERLRGRGTETEEAVRIRLGNAAGEIRYAVDYDYVVVNDDRERAEEEVLNIVRAEGSRRSRLFGREDIEDLARRYESWASRERAT
jgi:guanylate kinase